MSLLESEIEGLTVAWAEDNGWLCPKLQWVAQTGWPDRTFIKYGVVALIEFKAPGGRVSPKQRYWINKLRMQNMPVLVCDDVLEAQAFLLALDKARG